MYYIIYSSYATAQFTDEQLKDLLIEARDKNDKNGVTGMLYYFNGQFVQLIEGAESTVRQLAKAIAIDPRHKLFVIIKEGMAEKRFFSEWSMGLRSIDPGNFEGVKCFKELNLDNGDHTESILFLFKLAG